MIIRRPVFLFQPISVKFMSYFKLLVLSLLILCSGFYLEKRKPYLTKWVINRGCSLKVGGSTNINKFDCVISNYAQPDTLTFYKNNINQSLKITGSINLDVQNFNCHNPVMTSDLRKTLKAKQFPNLSIRFISLSKYPTFNDQINAVTGVVSIELAGITKKYEVDYKFISDGTKSLNLIGSRKVNFSDFNIIPPRKLGGMIQTNNELTVEFNLKMKVLE